MSRSSFLPLPPVLAALALAGCNTPPQNARIAERAATYEQLPAETRQALAKGAIDRDYSFEMVYIALGRPDGIEATADGLDCRWTYRRFYFSSQVKPEALYTPRPRLTPGAPIGRVFGMAKPAFTQPSSSSMRMDSADSAPSTSGSGSSGAPDVPAVTLEVIFHEGRVHEVVTDPATD